MFLPVFLMAVPDRTERIWLQLGRPFKFPCSLKFLRFSSRQNQRWFCLVRADLFGSAAGGLPAMLRKAIAGGGHHFGNGEIVWCGARNAAPRCERRKGKIQICRKLPIKQRIVRANRLINNFLWKKFEFFQKRAHCETARQGAGRVAPRGQRRRRLRQQKFELFEI